MFYRSKLNLRPGGLAVAAFVLFVCASAYGQSMPGYQAPDKPKAAELSVSEKAAQGKAPLSQLYGHLKTDPAKVKRLPALDPREKLKTLPSKALRIGAIRTLPKPIKGSSDGTVYQIAEGDVRVFEVVSEGALYTRVHFKGMSLPDGARVFVYSLANPDEYYGPYEGRGLSDDGTFWTPPMKGDGVVIEYFVPKGAENFQSSPFKISEVAHVYTDPMALKLGGCHNDVTSPWIDTAKAVGRLEIVVPGGVGLCTGTLLNDNDLSSDIPYVLTANHCLSTQSQAQSLRVYWNYNTGNSPPGGTPFTDGANLLATGTTSDFTFLRLTGSLPGGLFFSGWDAATFSGSAAAAAIHHPDGSYKRISFGTARQPTSQAECNQLGAGFQCLAVDWSSGVTEPGSSGSGVWKGLPGDAGGAKLIGTLTGGPSACGAPPANLKDFYGRFSVTYPNIASFLEGTSCVTSLSPTSQSFGASGGSGSFTVNAPAGCNWSVNSAPAFVTITPPNSGTGPGTINFSVTNNTSVQRSGAIVVGALIFTVNQAGGAGCPSTPINIGETKAGSLSTSDCPFGDGRFLDSYSFSGAAGQQISISMSSTAIDTYLYLLNPNGSTLASNDDSGGSLNSRIPAESGFLTLPATGSYTILATSFDAGETGSYSLTLTGSAPPAPRTLTVASTNPASGVSITVSPIDNNGFSNGTTQFTRTYNQGTTATLTAAGTAPNGNIFHKWQKDGVDWSSSTSALVTMDADHTMTAFYVPEPIFVLTVASSNPDSGVAIAVGTIDNNGQLNGTTQFTRTYAQHTFVSLVAPLTAPNGNVFQKWQKNGVDVTSSNNTFTMMDGPQTMTAVYVAPATFMLTVNSSNPNSGVNITVSPNDQGGLGNGSTQFTRSYNQNTTVTLTAPAAASNGNVFDRWLVNGSTASFSPSTNVFMSGNVSITAVYLTKPVIYAEEGTNNAAALDSVAFLRGPFRLFNPNNFTTDQRTRIILFTSELGLTQSDLTNPATLVVQVPGANFTVENVGTLSGVPGLGGSYIVARLPDNLPTGALQLTIMLRGVPSDARILHIVP